MSANLKIGTMKALLVGAALLTPLAAQDRNHNDRNDSRNANHGSYQNQGQRPGVPNAVENRGGFSNRGPVASAPRNDFSNRGDRNDNRFDRNDNRFDRNDNRFDRNDNRFRGGYSRPVVRYVSRHPGRYWSTGEDRAFRFWLAQRHLAYTSFDACDPYLQDEYWDWRDTHSDRVLFSFNFGIR